MPAPSHLVHLQKNEYAATGGDAADESAYIEPVEAGEDAPAVQGFFLQAPGSTSYDKKVWVSRDASGNMIFFDDVDATERTLTDLLTGAGITENQHDALDDLVHWLAEDHHIAITRAAGKISNATAWTDGTKTTKVRELANIVRTGGKIDSYDLIQYNGSGTEIQRLAFSVTRASGKVSSIDITETGS